MQQTPRLSLSQQRNKKELFADFKVICNVIGTRAMRFSDFSPIALDEYGLFCRFRLPRPAADPLCNHYFPEKKGCRNAAAFRSYMLNFLCFFYFTVSPAFYKSARINIPRQSRGYFTCGQSPLILADTSNV